MAVEIERKFLVTPGVWQPPQGGVLYRQGYLSSHPERIVRVRVAGDRGYLTVKGLTRGAARLEYEYPIPVADAGRMLALLCEKPLVEKKRYTLVFAANTWEVDEFLGENEGLVVAEIELDYPGQDFESPPWLGKEVTGDPRYFNSNLARHPYNRWPPL